MSFISIPFTFFKSFIRKGHSRSVKAKKNILAIFVIKGLSIGISFMLLPLTIHYVNASQYGIWITLTSIIGWFSYFDIGFGNGLRNKFAEAVAKGQNKLARIYVSTTYAVLSIIGSFILLLFFCINPFLNWTKILNTPPNMASELSTLAMIIFVFFCLQFVLQLINTILNGNQQPAKVSLFNFLGSLLSFTVIFILAKTTAGNLLHLGLAFSCAPVLVLIVSSIWLYKHEYRKYAPSFKYVKFSFARNLMSLGLKFFIIQIAVIVVYQTSNIIIAQLFGPAEVTGYNVAYKYFSIIPMALSIVTTPFWSAYTEAYVEKDFSWIETTMKKLIFIWFLFSMGGLVMLAFSNKLYSIWIGSAIKMPFLLSATILFSIIINAWCAIFSIFLNAIGKLRLQLYSALFGALVNIPLAIFLGNKFGISGVVLSTCLLAVTSAIWSPIQYYKIMNNTARGIWNK